jgi:hypothetical protein
MQSIAAIFLFVGGASAVPVAPAVEATSVNITYFFASN